MNVIQYKIWHDLWHSKGRTVQVVLIIAMGAFALGMIIGSRTLLIDGMAEAWSASAPSMINLTADPTVDDEMVQSLKSIRGIVEVEGYAEKTVEWRLTPNDEWQPATLIARDDYDDQKYAKISLVSGAWPTDKVFAVEQGADAAFGIPEDGQLYLRIEDKEHRIKLGGTVYNPVGQPPSFGGNAAFYTTRDRFGDLTGDRDFNRLVAGAATFDEAAVTVLADQMQRRLEKQDIEVGEFFPGRVSNPNKHFFQDVLDGIFMLLGLMGIVALVLGLFLVYNTINAIITQQVSQIGIMKAIGARTRQILRVYLTMVLVYGVLALLIAVPLGMLGAYGMSLFMLNAFNAGSDGFNFSYLAIAVQVAICLLTPLLVSLVPIFTGSRITVREAISSYGLSAQTGRLSRWLAKTQQLSRSLLLVISNTFRNKWRVILTQLTLIGSGLIFMMVMSVGDSVRYTFGDLLFSILQFDVSLAFEDEERIDQVERLTLSHPDVRAVEMWGFGGGTIRRADQPESNDDEGAVMFGVPLPTQLYGPQLRQGRWLEPTDTYAVVLNQKLAEEAGVTVGDWIIFDQALYGESQWQVVGLLFDPIITDSAHVPRDILLKEVRSVGKTGTVWIQTRRSDAAGEQAAAAALREFYDEHQLEVSPQSPFGRDTASEITAQILNNFGIIVTLLATMSLVMGAVGGIALSGVLSLSVLERRREIGVMRAIGASSWTIARLFIGEGLMLGWLSWLVAAPLSIPAGYLMARGLGAALQGEIVYHYTPIGALYWLAIVTGLAIVASWLPARGATRISVQESLAYQ